jgi:hypothetical protein
MSDWFEFIAPKGEYSGLAEVTPPPGFREVSRIFDESGLVKVFFEKTGEKDGC